MAILIKEYQVLMVVDPYMHPEDPPEYMDGLSMDHFPTRLEAIKALNKWIEGHGVSPFTRYTIVEYFVHQLV
jgi:hypothetical protein